MGNKDDVLHSALVGSVIFVALNTMGWEAALILLACNFAPWFYFMIKETS